LGHSRPTVAGKTDAKRGVASAMVTISAAIAKRTANGIWSFAAPNRYAIARRTPPVERRKQQQHGPNVKRPSRLNSVISVVLGGPLLRRTGWP